MFMSQNVFLINIEFKYFRKCVGMCTRGCKKMCILYFRPISFLQVWVSLVLLHCVSRRLWGEFESPSQWQKPGTPSTNHFLPLTVCQPIASPRALGWGMEGVSLARFQDLALAHWTHSARKDRVQRGIHHLQHWLILASLPSSPLPTSYWIQEMRWRGRIWCKICLLCACVCVFRKDFKTGIAELKICFFFPDLENQYTGMFYAAASCLHR